MILDLAGCEYRHRLDYREVIQMHGLDMFIADLLNASPLIVDENL
jgi:hypothetical protein